MVSEGRDAGEFRREKKCAEESAGLMCKLSGERGEGLLSLCVLPRERGDGRGGLGR
jgi:hypothetical protein